MPNMPPIPAPLSHAYIVTGGSAADRTAYAVRLAQAYVCREERPPCLRCRDCEKAAAGIHPDVITVAPAEGKRDILVDQARALRADAYIRPNEAERKVYLIHSAESMRTEAQNALLKVLEEGPAYAAFLLLTDRAGGLLQTIRSRCETIILPPARAEEVPAEIGQGAEELLRRLAARNEAALAEFCVSLEKWDREGFSALLAEAAERLRAALVLRSGGTADGAGGVREAAALTAAQLLEASRLCGRLGSACEFNVGVGHLAGWLCAGLAAI